MGSHGRRGAKIVATLGPASAERATIRAMVEAGLDVARLNFSHGDHRALRALIAHVRAVQAESGKPLAIVGDLRGPKIRLGPLPEPIPLASGSHLRISMVAGHAGLGTVSCDYAGLADDVRTGDSIFLRDGAIELEVTGVTNESAGKAIETLVRSAGTLTSRAGVNVPGVRVRLPAPRPTTRRTSASLLQRGSTTSRSPLCGGRRTCERRGASCNRWARTWS